jgi:Glycosyl hydrolases family 28
MDRRQMIMLTAAMASGPTLADASRRHESKDGALPLYDPIRFGAKGDGKALDSPAINAAIDACNRAGGGLVYLRPGVYRSGTVVLKSNVTLYVEAGATILGSLDLDDYTAMPGPPMNGDANQKHLIFAKGAENVTLAGPGRIDGQGQNFWEPSGRPPLPPEDQWADVVAHEWKKKASGRPSPMLEFVECRWLRIEDLRIENSPGWTMRPYNCDNVTISGIAVKNPVYGSNTDGMDITGSQNVSVSNCSIDTGDDAICIKSEAPYGGEPRVTKNIVVTNCVLTTCCNGFKLGTATEGGFENITFSNSVIYNNDVPFKNRVISGVALEVVDGGWIDGVVVTGIQMQRTRTPVFIRLGNRRKPFDFPQHGLRDVSIENIQASGALLASSITGLPGMEVHDVTLSNLRIDNVLPCLPQWVGRAVSEAPKAYPEARMFGMLPASGLYVRHVRGLRLEDLVFSATASEARPTVIFDDVISARISGFATTPIADAQPILQLTDSSDVWISESAAPGSTSTFLSVNGAESGNILLSGNDLRGARTAFKVADDVAPGVVSSSGNISAKTAQAV